MALDSDGYPLQESLDAIEQYDLFTKPLAGLLALLRETWWAADWGYSIRRKTLHLSTGGWSGNEKTVQYLKRNYSFWRLCWEDHRVGGHYRFRLREFPGDKAATDAA